MELLGDRVRVEVAASPAPSSTSHRPPWPIWAWRGSAVWLAAKATETVAYPESG